MSEFGDEPRQMTVVVSGPAPVTVAAAVPTAAGDVPVTATAAPATAAATEPASEVVTPEVLAPETAKAAPAAAKRGRPAKSPATVTTTATEAPKAPAPSSPAVDVTVMPFGSKKGLPFAQMTDKGLALLENKENFLQKMSLVPNVTPNDIASFTDAHRAEVAKVVEARKAQAGEQVTP